MIKRDRMVTSIFALILIAILIRRSRSKCIWTNPKYDRYKSGIAEIWLKPGGLKINETILHIEWLLWAMLWRPIWNLQCRRWVYFCWSLCRGGNEWIGLRYIGPSFKACEIISRCSSLTLLLQYVIMDKTMCPFCGTRCPIQPLNAYSEDDHS